MVHNGIVLASQVSDPMRQHKMVFFFLIVVYWQFAQVIFNPQPLAYEARTIPQDHQGK